MISHVLAHSTFSSICSHMLAQIIAFISTSVCNLTVCVCERCARKYNYIIFQPQMRSSWVAFSAHTKGANYICCKSKLSGTRAQCNLMVEYSRMEWIATHRNGTRIQINSDGKMQPYRRFVRLLHLFWLFAHPVSIVKCTVWRDKHDSDFVIVSFFRWFDVSSFHFIRIIFGTNANYSIAIAKETETGTKTITKWY